MYRLPLENQYLGERSIQNLRSIIYEISWVALTVSNFGRNQRQGNPSDAIRFLDIFAEGAIIQMMTRDGCGSHISHEILSFNIIRC